MTYPLATPLFDCIGIELLPVPLNPLLTEQVFRWKFVCWGICLLPCFQMKQATFQSLYHLFPPFRVWVGAHLIMRSYKIQFNFWAHNNLCVQFQCSDNATQVSLGWCWNNRIATRFIYSRFGLDWSYLPCSEMCLACGLQTKVELFKYFLHPKIVFILRY